MSCPYFTDDPRYEYVAGECLPRKHAMFIVCGFYEMDNTFVIDTFEGQKFQVIDMDSYKRQKLERNALDIDRGTYNWSTEQFDGKWKLDFPESNSMSDGWLRSVMNAVQIPVYVCEYFGEVLPPAKYDRHSYTLINTKSIEKKRNEPKAVPIHTPRQTQIINTAYWYKSSDVIQRLCVFLTNRIQMSVLTELDIKRDVEELEAYQWVLEHKYPYLNQSAA